MKLGRDVMISYVEGVIKISHYFVKVVISDMYEHGYKVLPAGTVTVGQE
jgi:hypothetical protein